jgi:outer membrane protein TolC
VITKALSGNAQVSDARARRQQADAERVQADSARWPQVTLDVAVGPSLRAELVPGTAAESTRSRCDLAPSDLSFVVGGRLSVVQPLYTFGKIDAFRAAAGHGVRARDAQTCMTQAEVALEVARLYEGLLFARDAERFLEELEHYVERTILATEERAQTDDAGSEEQDVLRLQTALAVVRLSLHYAQAAHRQANAGVAMQLGLAQGTPVEPREDELKPLGGGSADRTALVATALRLRPELEALQQGALAYDSLAAAERAGVLPDVFLMGFADGAYTPGRDLIESRYVSDLALTSTSTTASPKLLPTCSTMMCGLDSGCLALMASQPSQRRHRTAPEMIRAAPKCRRRTRSRCRTRMGCCRRRSTRSPRRSRCSLALQPG